MSNMNSEVLKRYDMTVDNKFIISVSVPDYKALFENYDLIIPIVKRQMYECFYSTVAEDTLTKEAY